MKSLFDIPGFIDSERYIAVWLLMWIESFFPIIPSEVVLPLSISVVQHGHMTFFAVVAAAVAGSMTGAVMWYALARWLGIERFGGFVTHYGRYTSINAKEVAMLQRWFDQRGGIMVFACRVLPLVRSVISIPAGLTRMPFGRFFVYSLAGCCIWSGTLCAVSWWARAYIEQFHALIGPGVKIVVVGLVALWLYRVVSFKAENNQ